MARKKSAAKRAKEAAVTAPDASNSAKASQPEIIESKPVITTEQLKKELLEDINNNSDDDEESSEDEDNYGELLTPDVEEGLSKVLTAIKTGDKSLFDDKVRFFKDPEEGADIPRKSKDEKPLYLKDYHRKNLLDGNAFEEEDGEERDWNDEKPYALQQKEDKENLLSEIKNAFDGDSQSGDDEDEGDFLVKKEKSAKSKAEEELALPDPKENSEEFLQAFLDSQAWIPKGEEKSSNSMEEDDDEFDEAAERFENAYNFRFEDPNGADIISYARSQATMRRENTNSRKRQREKLNEDKRKENEAKLELLKKKKSKKVNEVMSRLKQIREAVGEDVPEETITKVFGESLLADEFNVADWDAKMAQIFDEQYYDAGDKKPEWDDDDELMQGFKGDESDKSDDDEEEVYADADQTEEKEEAEVETKSTESKSKRSKKKEEKLSSKQGKNKLKSVAETFVNANSVQLLEQVEEERGRKKEKDTVSFKYREVSPESFGLSTREILLAEDKDLNEFIGLKKFAPYRPKDQRQKDKRKYAKKRRLRDWRLKTFNNADGPAAEDGDEDIIKIPSIVDGGHKHKKRRTNDSKGKKSKK
ncbi:hypothetical protein CANARDRAFT_28600 [[Candida] arabinofermentans NRRL YB-2248]|uniref:Kri1-like C-terminal domain-containing protein n=1 Tax=[Candida] arabinofermentans NRRL YB-2248 TaxID=983967 RepID=A0A1E4T0R1_9ASCO|nr:hypothetical protein CANARDRAFT_28600 [[Candida] arabinofermentans NRRL YB-2248]